jgi:hypothetical protein
MTVLINSKYEIYLLRLALKKKKKALVKNQPQNKRDY